MEYLEFANAIIKNGEIDITEDMWRFFNENMSKDTIKEIISHAIEEHFLDLPYRKITLEEAIGDFKELCKKDCLELFEKTPFFTRYDYAYPFSNIIINQNKIGNKSSDYFHQRARWKCDSINAPSPYRSWTMTKFRKTLLNALWTLKVNKVDNTTLRTAIGLRKYIASQFRPTAAKAIYQYFNSKRVLDFSSGWGDRLSAFMATDSTEKYLGCDPNSNLFEGYYKQIQLFNKNKDIELLNKPAEECNFGTEEFDTVFTSPPYFIIERYTQNSNQSHKRYRKLDDWLDKFLFTAIQNSVKALKKGGYLIINISDVYCNHTINKICDPMCEYIVKKSGCEFVECIGLRMSKRPNSKSDKKGVFAEPVWIFRK